MQLTAEQDAFSDGVAWAARSLPTRPPIQALLGLLLEADEDGLAVSAFDYEVSSRVAVPCAVREPGRLVVPGRLLADIVRSLPAQPVDLRLEATRLVLTCGAARFTLPTLPVEEYPLPPLVPDPTGRIDSELFATAVRQVAVAAGRDDMLPVLTAVRVEIEGPRLTLAATDRYRLAVRTLTWQGAEPDLATVALVPARTLADVAKALTGGPEVELGLTVTSTGEGLIAFVGGPASQPRRTTSRLLEGEFPKYRSLLPSDSSAVAEVSTTVLSDAVRRVALVAARNAPVRLAFSAEGLVLEAGGADDAQASERLDCSWTGAEPMEIAFNPAYLLDGLAAVGDDLATLSFTTATRPAVLRGKDTGEELDDYRYLLMPVRLSG